MENEKLDIYFYIYAAVEILLAFVGAYLITKGINLMVWVLWIHVGGHVYIVMQGKKNNRYETYRLYMGFVVPFMLLSFMLWYNTF
jgi:hypothetical protein